MRVASPKFSVSCADSHRFTTFVTAYAILRFGIVCERGIFRGHMGHVCFISGVVDRQQKHRKCFKAHFTVAALEVNLCSRLLSRNALIDRASILSAV